MSMENRILAALCCLCFCCVFCGQLTAAAEVAGPPVTAGLKLRLDAGETARLAAWKSDAAAVSDVIPDDVAVKIASGGEEDSATRAFCQSMRKLHVLVAL